MFTTTLNKDSWHTEIDCVMMNKENDNTLTMDELLNRIEEEHIHGRINSHPLRDDISAEGEREDALCVYSSDIRQGQGNN